VDALFSMRRAHGGLSALVMAAAGGGPYLLRMRNSCLTAPFLELSMTRPSETPFGIAETPEPIDVIAIERRARELRAQALADLVRAASRWIAARLRGSAAAPAAGEGRAA
jgi:hypothetical protein